MIIKQIAVAQEFDKFTMLYALDQEGAVWRLRWEGESGNYVWRKVKAEVKE